MVESRDAPRGAIASGEESNRAVALLLLGSPAVERAGSGLRFDTRKAVALLAYLAVTRTPQARDHLAGLLWPEHDQGHARAALRRTLSTLNRVLAGEGLRIGRNEIAVDAESLWVDEWRFHELASGCSRHQPPSEACPDCRGRLGGAVELHRGDFLSGFGLRDSPEFDDWQFLEAQRLRRELAVALDRLVTSLVSHGELDAALRHAHRWLALDPLQEAAHRRLMQLYAWDGQRSAALRQYRECVALLDRELGVAPVEETTALYEAIKEGAAAPPAREGIEAAASPGRR
ncbi:MAG: AfsR/SARP family transcriptional regulator, partial [Actinomycetota bacterium]